MNCLRGTSFHLHFLKNLYLSFVIVSCCCCCFFLQTLYFLCRQQCFTQKIDYAVGFNREFLVGRFAVIFGHKNILFEIPLFFVVFVLSCLLCYIHFGYNENKGVKKRLSLGYFVLMRLAQWNLKSSFLAAVLLLLIFVCI